MQLEPNRFRKIRLPAGMTDLALLQFGADAEHSIPYRSRVRSGRRPVIPFRSRHLPEALT